MNVAINALAVGPGMTGIGAYAQGLVSATCRSDGSHSYLYLTGAKGQNLPTNSRSNVRLVAVEDPTAAWEQLHLPGELAASEADLYHSPLFTCPVVQAVPSVITIHDVIPETRPDLCSEAFLHFYGSRIGPSLEAASWAVTTSDFSRSEALEHLDVMPDRIFTIYQGISGRFSPDAYGDGDTNMTVGGHPIPERYILYVGMVEPRKNVERLIAAFGAVARKDPALHLVVAGRKDDPSYSLDAAISGSGAVDRILEAGYVDDEDLPGVYAAV